MPDIKWIFTAFFHLPDALFLDPPSPRTENDRLDREKEIRKTVIDLVPRWAQKIVFNQDLYLEGANSLVNLFQHPVLNKQVKMPLIAIILN